MVCRDCGRTDSPEWRKGPEGPKTLCNACGMSSLFSHLLTVVYRADPWRFSDRFAIRQDQISTRQTSEWSSSNEEESRLIYISLSMATGCVLLFCFNVYSPISMLHDVSTSNFFFSLSRSNPYLVYPHVVWIPHCSRLLLFFAILSRL